MSFNVKTPDKLCQIISRLYKDGKRYRFDFGNVETGESWKETYDIDGYIGRSTGICKMPILIYNSRSMGGGAILTDCILSITEIKTKKLVYSI